MMLNYIYKKVIILKVSMILIVSKDIMNNNSL